MPEILVWEAHVYRAGAEVFASATAPGETASHRRHIEPWLAAIFQSEHVSLLLGSGFTSAIAALGKTSATGMGPLDLENEFAGQVMAHAKRKAEATGRGAPNIEDQIRSAMTLVAGLDVLGDAKAAELRTALDAVMRRFLSSLLETEARIRIALDHEETGSESKGYLISFLLSFASRAASRERLNIFTTNYDRLVEYGCDLVGLRVLDRFVGGLTPVFRSSRLDVDVHYNPPGIRGEPRYLEGVVRLTKLHGSLDWRFDGGVLRRYGISFGACSGHPDLPERPVNSVMIYPNPAKDVQTLEYPYAELFRDFSAGVSRPNSVLVSYGYGFGDDHINRIIADMLTIPSTHLVIISHSDADGRIPRFCQLVNRSSQVSVMVGQHFGDLKTLVDHYLPKAAIDQITWRKTDLLERRGDRGHRTGEDEKK
jgi:hypothetical protein